MNGWHVKPKVILMTDGRATNSEYPDGPENPDLFDKAQVCFILRSCPYPLPNCTNINLMLDLT